MSAAMDTPRALTVRQPWAGAIIWGGKDVENRTQPTKYRGRLWIHAGLAHPAYEDYHSAAWLAERSGTNGGTPDPHLNWADTRRLRGAHLASTQGIPFSTSTLGAILGTAELADCHHADDCAHICPEPEDWNPESDWMPCEEHEGPCRNHCSPWALPEQWHWVLRDVQPLPSVVPCKGKLGLWRLPDDVAPLVAAERAA